MPYDAVTTESMVLDGIPFLHRVTDKAASVERSSPSLPAAAPGSVTAAGVVTLTGTQPFKTGDVVGIFWTGGKLMAAQVTVAGQALTVTGGTGGPLPAVGTPVMVGLVVVTAFTVDDGTGGVMALGLSSQREVHVDILDITPAVVVSLTADDQAAYLWRKSDGHPSPLAGAVTAHAYFACAEAFPITPQLAAAFNTY